MQNYLDLLKFVLDSGEIKKDRTGTGTKSIFGYQMRYPLETTFPLITTKKVHLKSIFYELIWFLKGDTNISYLNKNGVTIWDEWADEKGDLGPIYGAQWRNWGTFDQISQILHLLRTEPDSRRMIVSAWNVGELQRMALPPCHVLFQFYVSKGRISCHLYQRSADLFLGVPFNIASYALLTVMISHVVGLRPGELVHSFGDVHLYLNHIEQVKLQLERTPKQLPSIVMKRNVPSLFEFQFEDIELVNYHSYPAIKAPIAV